MFTGRKSGDILHICGLVTVFAAGEVAVVFTLGLGGGSQEVSERGTPYPAFIWWSEFVDHSHVG